jgi:hypothetical protein
MQYIRPLTLEYMVPRSQEPLLVDYRLPILESITRMSHSQYPDASSGVSRTLLGIDDCVRYRLSHPHLVDQTVLCESVLDTSCAVVGISPTKLYVCTQKSTALTHIISDAVDHIQKVGGKTPASFRYALPESFAKKYAEQLSHDSLHSHTALAIPSDIRQSLLSDPFSQTDWRVEQLWPFFFGRSKDVFTTYARHVFEQTQSDATCALGFDLRTMHTGVRFCYIGDISQSRSTVGLSEVGSIIHHCVGEVTSPKQLVRVLEPQHKRFGPTIGSLIEKRLKQHK